MSENSIQVNIGGRIYTPNVKTEDVENVVKAAGLINERMRIFEKTYAVKDKQDLVAMCCLQFATQYLETEKHRSLESDEVSGKIISLEKFISAHLDKEV
jgi:cell division protein ZapA